VLRGDLDPGGDALLKLVPSGRKAVIADCGHVGNIERPEAFTAQMLDFLASLPTG
jgi:pimeloyl-ACP methyl ester carboxylesterase